MKVFFSYGHDANAPLVRLLRKRLEARGATVWMDEREIRSGDEWRRAILAGLNDNPRLVAFISAHAVRPESVCLDEVGFALHHLKGQLIPVLLEAGIEGRIPVSFTDTQWLNLSEWQARRAEGEAEFEAWLDGKEAELWRILTDPDRERFSGEIETLRQRLFAREASAAHGLLSPWGRGFRIGRLLDGFVGREWLRDRVNAWRVGEPHSRLLWIAGPPGMGKSAFAAWIAHHGFARVVALNLAEFNDGATRDTHRVIRALALQVAARDGAYRDTLLRRLPEGAELPASPHELFRWIILDPLAFSPDGGRSKDPLLIVLDGLDETMDGERCELAEILAECADRLPAWVNVLVTSRKMPAIETKLGAYRPEVLEPSAEDNRRDLEAYARGWLGAPAPEGLGLEGDALESRVAQATAAAEGNILYLRVLRDGVRRGLLRQEALDKLPPGLGPLFDAWLLRQFRDDKTTHRPRRTDYAPQFRPLLAVLCVSETPVPTEALEAALGLDELELADRLRAVAGLFERRVGGWAPFHKSLRDWLLSELAGPWRVSAQLGWRTMAPVVWRGLKNPDDFVAAEFPRFVAARGTNLVGDVAENGGATTLELILAQANKLEATLSHESALRWWHALALAAEAGKESRYQRFALVAAGDRLRILGHTSRALQAFRASMAIAESLAADDPADLNCQYNVATGHQRIGRTLWGLGDLEGALGAFRTSKTLLEPLAAGAPADPELQFGLVSIQGYIGGVLRELGDPNGALAAFREAMAVAEGLAARDPHDVLGRRSLLHSHHRIGEALGQQGNLDGALAAFREAMAVAEGLAARDLSELEWQRALAAGHQRIGEVLWRQHDLDGALAAFRAAVAVAGKIAAHDAASADVQSDLLIGYQHLGGVLQATGNLDDALAAFQAAMAIAAQIAARDPADAEAERYLLRSHGLLGDVLTRLGHPDARAHLEAALAMARARFARLGAQPQTRSDLTAIEDLTSLLDAE